MNYNDLSKAEKIKIQDKIAKRSRVKTVSQYKELINYLKANNPLVKITQ